MPLYIPFLTASKLKQTANTILVNLAGWNVTRIIKSTSHLSIETPTNRNCTWSKFKKYRHYFAKKYWKRSGFYNTMSSLQLINPWTDWRHRRCVKESALSSTQLRVMLAFFSSDCSLVIRQVNSKARQAAQKSASPVRLRFQHLHVILSLIAHGDTPPVADLLKVKKNTSLGKKEKKGNLNPSVIGLCTCVWNWRKNENICFPLAPALVSRKHPRSPCLSLRMYTGWKTICLTAVWIFSVDLRRSAGGNCLQVSLPLAFTPPTTDPGAVALFAVHLGLRHEDGGYKNNGAPRWCLVSFQFISYKKMVLLSADVSFPVHSGHSKFVLCRSFIYPPPCLKVFLFICHFQPSPTIRPEAGGTGC